MYRSIPRVSLKCVFCCSGRLCPVHHRQAQAGSPCALPALSAPHSLSLLATDPSPGPSLALASAGVTTRILAQNSPPDLYALFFWCFYISPRGSEGQGTRYPRPKSMKQGEENVSRHGCQLPKLSQGKNHGISVRNRTAGTSAAQKTNTVVWV